MDINTGRNKRSESQPWLTINEAALGHKEKRGEEEAANGVIRGEESCCWEKDFVLDYFLLLGAYREPAGVLHLSS